MLHDFVKVKRRLEECNKLELELQHTLQDLEQRETHLTREEAEMQLVWYF